MPSTREGYALAMSYRLRAVGAAAAVAALVAALWEDPEAGAAALADGQRAQVLLADVFLASFVTVETGRSVGATGLDPDRYVFAERLRSALTTAADASEAAARRVAHTEAMTAGRAALGGLMDASEDVEGFRRVAAGRACGACLSLASGRVIPTAHVFETHPACSCTAVPVVGGVRERFRPPTGVELDPERAALGLKRTGEYVTEATA